MQQFDKLERPSSFRKAAASMWRRADDPQIYGQVDIDATQLLEFIERYNQRHDCKITVTHVVVRALALAFVRHPEANCSVGIGHILKRQRVEIFCQVAVGGGRDLSGYKIPDTDEKSLAEIAAALNRGATEIRADKDPALQRSRAVMRRFPLWALRRVLGLMSVLNNDLHLHLPQLGLPKDAFGSAMVTNVGMFGIDTAWAPLLPIARCPIIVLVPQVKTRPWVVEGQVVPRPVLRLCGTFDHRIVDGFLAGKLNAAVEELLQEPQRLLLEGEAW